MKYGQFIYGWREYSTADFTEELAASLTNSVSAFNASVTRLLQAEYISFPDSTGQALGERLRTTVYLSSPESNTSFNVYKVVGIDLSASSGSTVSLGGVRLRTSPASITGASTANFNVYKMMSLEMESDSVTSGTITANFLTNASASLDEVSTATILVNMTYDGDFNSTVSGELLPTIEMLYNIDNPENESYTVLSKENETYTPISKGNETYTRL